MRLTRRGIYLDIDPDRPLTWILLELAVCLTRRGTAWMKAHPRTTLALVTAISTWLAIPVVSQHLGSVIEILRSRP
jgi:hypothetical protein